MAKFLDNSGLATVFSIIKSHIPSPSNLNPLEDNSDSTPGTSTLYARGDHVHPTDTTRAKALVVNAVAVSATTITLDTDYWTISHAIRTGASVVLVYGGYYYPFVAKIFFNNKDWIVFGFTTVYSGSSTTVAYMLPEGDSSTTAQIIEDVEQIPTAVSQLTNDSGFLTSSNAVTSFNGSTGAVTYTAPVTSVNSATGAVVLDADDIPYNGSQSVFEKISEIVTQGGEPNVIETVEQNGTPLTVTNKTVNVTVPTATSDLTNDSNYVSDADYVHTDNNYTTTEKNKLSGIASGAEVNVQSDWNVSDNTSDAYIKNKPTIPTVNNATLTIQKNGTTVKTFTANASTDVTANITVPTKTSDITNDSNFVSDASYVHTDNNYTDAEKTKLSGIASGAEVNVQSDWSETDDTDDSYIKNKPTIPTKTSDLTNDSDFVSDANYTHIAVVDTYSSTGTDAVSGKGIAAALGTLDSSVTAETNKAISAITITDGKISANSKITVPVVVDTYSSSGTDAISGTGVAGALATLDSSVSAETNKAISAITITDGKISANSKISIPTAVSDLTNDSGFLTSSDAVTSFNGSTGDITYTAPVTSVNSETGAVVLDATDIAYDSNNTVKEKIDAIISGGGEPNVIEVVEVNGVALTVTDKTVDVPVPTESTVAGWGFTKNTGTYSKPSTGIPETDLASDVQTSLGLADTAVQTETDPTVPSWAKASSKPSYSGSIADATTGISIADHSTTTIYGVGSSTTTASKVTVSGGNGSAPTLGTAFTIPNVTAAGSGSFTQGAFSGGSFSATVTDHEMSFSFTAATHGTDSHTHVVPTLGTAFTVPNVTSVGSASTWNISASDVIVPIKDATSTTVVTSKTHTVTDNGHTHTITIS